jgi:hypothetical protein
VGFATEEDSNHRMQSFFFGIDRIHAEEDHTYAFGGIFGPFLVHRSYLDSGSVAVTFSTVISWKEIFSSGISGKVIFSAVRLWVVTSSAMVSVYIAYRMIVFVVETHTWLPPPLEEMIHLFSYMNLFKQPNYISDMDI